MKLSIGLSAALSGLAAAAQQAAEVYILPTSESVSTTHVPPSLARLVFLQRLAATGKGLSSNDIPNGIDAEDVVSFFNKYGKTTPPLFGKDEPVTPSQLVVMLEGMTDKQIKDTGAAFEIQPAFTIADPPSSDAHEKLIKYDFYNVGVTNEHECTIDQVVNPFEEQCWSGKSTVAKYNVQEHPDILDALVEKFVKLMSLANSGEMETTVILLPKSAGSAKWSDKTQELRRRQAEAVMSSLDEADGSASAAPTSSATDSPILSPARGSIPACFKSEESCMSGTGNCSRHGKCVNKYADSDKETCYSCECLATESELGSVTHWAGAACSRQDVSVQFWLFAGFTLAMVGILALAIGMLFSVGEEKLPGVIGAGVSRNK